MQIDSLNIGKAVSVKWRNKVIKTGIFKSPVEGPLFLGPKDVEKDTVVDRKYHGGIDKACYAYSSEAYAHWQIKYPDQNFEPGFFGENLTILGLSEAVIRIGDQFKVGNCIVEVSQPREPCFKLGIRFGSQSILKPFINSPYPGIYFRVIQSGEVSKGDRLELMASNPKEPTVLEVYQIIYRIITDKKVIAIALQSDKLADSAKKAVQKAGLIS